MEPSKNEILDAPLHEVGFKISEISSHKITGHFPVTGKCCNPFEVLHGGVSALIAEALASMGAQVASEFQRVAGVHLSIHHLKSAHLGEIVYAEATPLNIGKSIHVWEVKLWKNDNSSKLGEDRILISSSRVTIKTNMVVPENVKDAAMNLKKYARL
ncbi:PREDICTED: 1,4-dihydroxy-2-naphthoyl-CoA thioesterase 1-like [Nicotiana attenuata]|uniref:1,4-dihydroxy-2-naphthoyl-coa thioesterase 1 n=1 Tax=Nicotiana attenuata TaxID=49451 RepID=A0A314KI53_NICAT|nr:PREDICTED: 1,4-dihydroxy-2-naphthoyl-CoA thioesterase 1-like [Nicotiana attenuata]OIT28888.1 1,4-dihydroxy-2-naphthoyl-coa thioesterase 1 [Nicotiana attenuata]